MQLAQGPSEQVTEPGSEPDAFLHQSLCSFFSLASLKGGLESHVEILALVLVHCLPVGEPMLSTVKKKESSLKKKKNPSNKKKNREIMTVGGCMGKSRLLYFAGGNTKWRSLYGKHFRGSSTS